MPGFRGKYEKGEATAAALVEGCLRELATAGYWASSLSAITRAGATTKNQLFHHFKSKAGLAAAALRHSQVIWDRDLFIPAQDHLSPASRLGFTTARLAQLTESGWLHIYLLSGLGLERPRLPLIARAEYDRLLNHIHSELLAMFAELAAEVSELGTQWAEGKAQKAMAAVMGLPSAMRSGALDAMYLRQLAEELVIGGTF